MNRNLPAMLTAAQVADAIEPLKQRHAADYTAYGSGWRAGLDAAVGAVNELAEQEGQITKRLRQSDLQDHQHPPVGEDE